MTTTTTIASESSIAHGPEPQTTDTMKPGQPLCTTCACPAPFVYMTYSSRSNIRLSVCERCGSFVDPLIEAPPLVIVLDLVLLKPRVFLHLLFNRGTPPLDAADGRVGKPVSLGSGTGSPTCRSSSKDDSTNDEAHEQRSGYDHQLKIRRDLALLFVATVVVESAIRLIPIFTVASSVHPDVDWPLAGQETITLITSTLLTTALEIAVQQSTTTALALAMLWLRGWYPPRAPVDKSVARRHNRDGRQEAFLPEMIPLTLQYTAIVPLVLECLLRIWAPVSGPAHAGESAPAFSLPYSPPSSAGTLPALSRISERLTSLGAVVLPSLPAHIDRLSALTGSALTPLVETYHETNLIWAGTRLLGGMSAGSGLRVLLPTRPWETTLAILVGWLTALHAARGWVFLISAMSVYGPQLERSLWAVVDDGAELIKGLFGHLD